MDSPQQIGPYRVLAPIARGGAGAVFRVADPHGGPDRALKLLDNLTVHAQRRFETEVASLVRVRHPNVLPIVDIVSAVDRAGAGVVLTSVAMVSQHAELARLVEACTQRDVVVGFGGQGVASPIPGLDATYLGNRVRGLPERLARLT